MGFYSTVIRLMRFRFATAFFLAVILLASFLLNLQHLGHNYLTYWDESFHALVARNLLKHPLEPTLIDVPYFPYDYRDWSANHIWLHKGILPLWTIALSFALIGITPIALRFPSLLLSTASAGITYAIGREVYGKRAGLVAAAIQAFLPEVTQLIHGYLWSDAVDVSLLFWSELGIYFVIRAMRTGTWRDMVLSGVCCGLAFLSKSYLALIIPALAVAAWLLPVFRLCKQEETRIRARHILALIGSFVLVAAPWTLYCIKHYPKEFYFESSYALDHFTQNIEGLAAPWDRVVFDYAIHLFHVFYTPVWVAMIALFPQMLKEKNAKLAILYLWAFGVVLPHLFAVTKTPTSILIAMPAFLLLLGVFVSESFNGNRVALYSWTAIMMMCLILPPVVQKWQRGYPTLTVFGSVMRQHLWVIWHLLATGVAVLAIFEIRKLVTKRQKNHPPGNSKHAQKFILGFCILAMIVLAGRLVHEAWEDTTDDQQHPNLRQIGAYIRTNLPENAVILFEWNALKWRRGDHQAVMFWSDRTCYQLDHERLGTAIPDVVRYGGIPYLVSPRNMALPIIFKSEKDHRTIYALNHEAEQRSVHVIYARHNAAGASINKQN